MAAITGANGTLYRKTTAAAQSMTTEATTDLGSNRYQITNGLKRYVDKTQTVSVYDNGVLQTSGYTFEYTGGIVEFDSPPTEPVTISGYYWTIQEVAQFYEWSLDLGADLEDITSFDSSGWKQHTPVNKEATGTAAAYWLEDSWHLPYGDADTTLDDIMPVLFNVDGVNDYYEGYFLVEGLTIDTPSDGVVKSSLSFKADGQVYYRSP